MRASLALSLLLLAGPAMAAAPVVRTIEAQFPTAGKTGFKLELPVGDVVISGTDGDQVKLVMELRCSRDKERCQKAADKMAVRSSERGSTLALEVEGYRSRSPISPDVRLEIPARLAVELDLGVGDVEIAGLRGDTEVDVGVGDVAMTVVAAEIAEVEVDTGVGEAELALADGVIDGSGLVGSHLEWTRGTGGANVEVDCGVGDVRVEVR